MTWCDTLLGQLFGSCGAASHDFAAVPEVDASLLGLAVCVVCGVCAIWLDRHERRG